MAKYALGVDYGSLSGRALLVNLQTGEEVATSILEYPHGVMDRQLPDGTPLAHDWALQHPQDYLDVLATVVPDVLNQSGVSPQDVVGIGIDFTSCTVLPVRADGTPLCFLPQYKQQPHAYVKLWKHHAAQDKANRLNDIARSRGEGWLGNYGGKISSEWVVPKIWQIADEAPHIYEEMDRFIEAGDWLVWQLCGRETRNSCTAGYKAIWNKGTGYPTSDFFAALDPRLEQVVADKLGTEILPLGSKAGELTPQAAQLTGLLPGTAVAVANVDAHVCVPAAGIDGPGKMLAIIGTSTCHMVMSRQEVQVPGICGVVADGVMPGFYGYEAGQSCVGDHFAWFVENCLPATYYEQAAQKGMGVHRYLREKAQELQVGESGLVLLDWWNGNRSVLVDVDLTGVMVGMTLQTRPEEIYRGLLEATAYGTRVLVEEFRACGVAVDEFIAAGGIPLKDPLMMQIYADVLNMPIHIAASEQGPALGAAMYGGVAAGAQQGGFDSIYEAARKLGRVQDTVYNPIPAHVAVYDQLFAEYLQLHDYFGRGGNDVMKRLKAIKKSASANSATQTV